MLGWAGPVVGQPLRLPAALTTARLPVPARCASRRRRLPGRPRPLRCSPAPGIAPPPGGAGARSCSGRAGSWTPAREEAAEVPAGEGGAEAPRSGGTGKKVAWRGPGWCVGGRGSSPRSPSARSQPPFGLQSQVSTSSPLPLAGAAPYLLCGTAWPARCAGERMRWLPTPLSGTGDCPSACRLCAPPILGLPFSLGGLQPSLCTPPPSPGPGLGGNICRAPWQQKRGHDLQMCWEASSASSWGSQAFRICGSGPAPSSPVTQAVRNVPASMDPV